MLTPPRLHLFFRSRVYTYLPGLVVLAASWLWVSPRWSEPSWMQLAAFSWVPIVEEVVFRKGVGPWLRRYSDSIWLGSYFSILLFSFLHVSPTVSRIFEGRLGLPLGPLLLGVSCELLYILTGRLAPCVVLHSVCNVVAVFFF